MKCYSFWKKNVNNNDSFDMIISNHLSSTKYQNEWANSFETDAWFYNKGESVIISHSDPL